MPTARSVRESPWRYLAIAPVAMVGALVAATTSVVGGRAVVTVVLVFTMALASLSDDDRLAWWWGFLLPIDFLKGVPPQILDLARYGGLVWLAIRFKPDVSASGRRYVVKFALLVAAVAIIRETGSLARADRFGIYIAFVMFVGAFTAPFVAVRVRAHRSILAGFMGGVLLSATVSIMQGADIPTLQEGNNLGSRFPGLASTTMLITWHLAFALIIAPYFLYGHHHSRLHRLTAVLVIPVGLIALVGNGAQGGLLGLSAAALVIGLRTWRKVHWRRALPYAVGALALLVVVGAAIAIADVRTPTIDGILGQGDYTNEVSRLTVNRQGLSEMMKHPLVGIGRTNFEDTYDLAPHFLPLEAGVTSGVLGFVVAGYLLWYLLSLVIKPPVGGRPSAWLGLALAAAMWSNTLIEMGGPFTGLPRFSLLLIAVLAARGEPWPHEAPGPLPTDEARVQSEADAH